MEFIADPHVHTIVSGDAHSTVFEYILVAREIGLKYICFTEHVNIIPRAIKPEFLKRTRSIPRSYMDVNLIRGVEVNIIDYEGKVDVPDSDMEWLDWVIASMHDVALPAGSVKDHTETWMKIAENPLIDCIGHCGNPRYDFDHKPVIKAFRDGGKIVEINNHSFSAKGRQGSYENCRDIASLCAEYGVPIVCSSDAHFVNNLGNFRDAVAMLEEIDFPEELVLNADELRFKTMIESKMNTKD